MTATAQITARDFSAQTLASLNAGGIRIIGITSIPGDGPMPWANSSRGYSMDDNGCGRIWSHAEVLEAARAIGEANMGTIYR